MRKAILMLSVPAIFLGVVILVVPAGKTPDNGLGIRQAVSGSPAESRGCGNPTAVAGLPFVANFGQVSPEVAFYVSSPGGAVFVTYDGRMVYDLTVARGAKMIGRVAVRESLVAARVGEIRGRNQVPAVVSSFTGSDPSRWTVGIPSYAAVDLGSIYDGIGLLLQYPQGNVKKIFEVEPGADPSVIRVEVTGAQGLAVSSHGELEVATACGPLHFTRPVAYQTIAGVRKSVDVAYITDGHTYGFSVGDYDRTETLTIDPLVASTFYGGSGGDGQYEVPCARDAEGYVYVANRTGSLDLPLVYGVYDSTLGGNNDVFIAKFDAGLTTLVAATYLGGSGAEGA
jgi:hypothetical protein